MACIEAKQESYYYNGEDITHPINRFDVRLEGQRGKNCRKSSNLILTLRTDLLFDLPQQWRIGVRMDLPYAWYWEGGKNSPCGPSIDHLDDSLLQILFVPPSWGNWTCAFGFKSIYPTAGDNLQIGDGKYEIWPSAGFKYDLSDWSNGAYFGLILRQAYNVAGYRSAHYVCKTYIEPFFNLNLSNQWFINISPELIYNWRIESWFVPFDLMVGKMINERLIISLEYETAIVYGYKQFTQSLEFRIGYFY